MSVQTAILIMLFYYYNGIITGSLAFPVGYTAVVYVLVSGLTPIEILTKIQLGVMPIMYFGKVRTQHETHVQMHDIYVTFNGLWEKQT